MQYINFGIILSKQNENNLTYTALVDISDIPSLLIHGITIDINDFEIEMNNDNYGNKLSNLLFVDEIKNKFIEVYESLSENIKIKFRISFSNNTTEIQSLKWELLKTPFENRIFIATDKKIHYTRSLSSSSGGWSDETIKNKEEIKCLIVIANPLDMDESMYSSINTTQIQSIRESFPDFISVDEFGYRNDESATLSNIFTQLRVREKKYDILYIIAHGSENSIMLENDFQTTQTVNHRRIVTIQPINI